MQKDPCGPMLSHLGLWMWFLLLHTEAPFPSDGLHVVKQNSKQTDLYNSPIPGHQRHTTQIHFIRWCVVMVCFARLNSIYLSIIYTSIRSILHCTKKDSPLPYANTFA